DIAECPPPPVTLEPTRPSSSPGRTHPHPPSPEASHDPETPQRTPLPPPLRRLHRPGPRPAPLRRDLESDGDALLRRNHRRADQRRGAGRYAEAGDREQRSADGGDDRRGRAPDPADPARGDDLL